MSAATPVLPMPTVAASPCSLLERAGECERRGQVAEAARLYEQIISNAGAEAGLLATALRKRASIHRRRHELDAARVLLERSCEIAATTGSAAHVAESLNSLALVFFVSGEWEQARGLLRRALATGAGEASLRARIEQNLGTMANVEGDLDQALAHYERSLTAFQAAGDDRGASGAHNNIGMNRADRALWEQADASFRASLALADTTGDVQLRGFALLNRTEVQLAQQQFEHAKASLDEALRIFDSLGLRDMKAEAYKFLGVLYRETGRTSLAEARLRAAVSLATEIGATLAQAEATRELALLYGQTGRNQESLALLSTAHRHFGRLNARRDLVDVATKVVHLESVYLEVVRNWGASIESSDTYTFGHSGRVAAYSVTVARAFGLTGTDLTTILVGAHLHDVGKIRVPHEILNKPGRLTDAEFERIRQHPLHGIEMLAAVDFPWDVRPIIRSHHEKLDGSGYPDRLRGDEVPLHAQIVCIADVYDALTTTRSYRPAMTHRQALATMAETPEWWRGDVLEAFMGSIGRSGPSVV